jgi:undecaprenyl-diphosphatase
MTTILEAGSTQWYGLLYSVWGQLAQVGEMLG